MEYRPLGRTDLRVSVICLGSMTWGQQNTEAEAHEQMDLALDHGVNFIDTAEMYAIPPRKETQGLTEAYIGSWLAARNNRDKVVLATKVTGPAARFPYLRDGKPRLNARHINQAIDDSLKRLQTDYVDLYQLHWPERTTNYFGRLGYQHVADEDTVSIEESLEALTGLIKAGKVRQIGISNETAWGAMSFARLADSNGLPRAVSIQNPYSLLNRSFEVGLAEVAIREDMGLLAYAPLGAGTLTGKYLGGAKPPGARLTLFPSNTRYTNPQALAATEAYVALAREHGLSPSAMALAYVNSRRFLTATIIGATSVSQLQENLASIDLTLDDAVLDGIEAIHARISNPAP